MSITLYSLPTCQPCKTLKEGYIKAEIPFTEVVIGVDITKEEFFKKYPDARSVPYVVTE